MMASGDLFEYPAFAFQNFAEALLRNRFHTAISSVRSPFAASIGGTFTDKQPSTASYKFVNSSSKLSPWVAQPGIAGTSAQKPPSSASWTTTLSFTAQDRCGRVYPSDQKALGRVKPGRHFFIYRLIYTRLEHAETQSHGVR